MNGTPADSDPSDESTDETTELGATRREYLQTAAAAAAGFAAVGTVPDAADAASYDTVTIPKDSTKTISVTDGETYENVLFDMTADGASAQIVAEGSDWTIRNVGFKGVHPGGHYLIRPGVEDSSGTGLVENVYLGDGQVEGTGKGGIWIDAALPHRGTITFRNVHVAGMVDNGIYGSGVGYQGYCGNHHVEESYFYNNTISNNRTNAKCRRCDVYDTVVYVDGDQPACDVDCTSPGSNHTRGFWSWYGETYLENVDVKVVDGDVFATEEGGYFTKNNVRTGTDADLTPPDCVPTTAEDAAMGSSCDGSGTTEVAEDFSHADVPGTYHLDTGAFTTTTAHSTTDSYSIRPDDDTDDGRIVLREDMVTTAGNTYELDVYHQSGTDADMGFLFGAQDAVTGWSDYTGYIGWFDSTGDEFNIEYWEDGSEVTPSTTALSWPLNEWLTVELDYRDTDSGTITSTVFDASGEQLGSVSLNDTTYDGGVVGWYNYFANADWHADSWFDATPSSTVLDDFEDGDLTEYSGSTGGYQVQDSTVLEGGRTLEATGTYDQIAHSHAATPRGYEYACRIEAAEGSDAEPSLFVSVQDPSTASRNAYWAFPNASANEFNLIRRDDGDSTELDSVSYAPAEGVEYELAIELGTETVKAVLYDSSGTVVAETATVTDSTYSGGTFGFYTGGGTPGYYDDVRKTPL